MTKTERKYLIQERHQARAGVSILDVLPTTEELPQPDVSDLARTYRETTKND